MSIELVRASNYVILCCPLLLPPSIFTSIRVFSNESVLHIRWPKYWSFSFSISPSNQYSALVSFRMNLLDLLAVQGTLKSLLQHHSSKASILRRSAFSSELNSPIPVHFSSLIPKMAMFTLAIFCLTTSNSSWFMDLTFQQHWTLLPSPVTSTTGHCFHFGLISSLPGIVKCLCQ